MLKNQKGQGLVEYAVIIGLFCAVAICCVGIVILPLVFGSSAWFLSTWRKLIAGDLVTIIISAAILTVLFAVFFWLRPRLIVFLKAHVKD